MAQTTKPDGTGFKGGLYAVLSDGTYQPIFDADGNQVAATSASVQSISGAGAVNTTTSVTRITTTGANAYTLADGTNGQVKTIVMAVDGGDATITPTTKIGYSTIVFDAIGDSVTLRFLTGIGWIVEGNNGAAIS